MTRKESSNNAAPAHRSADVERLKVVLVRTRNPLNIGAAARAMRNFGFHHLRVVNPYEPAFREARSAVGASGVLARAREYKNVADAVADCVLVVGTTAGRQRELRHEMKVLTDGGAFIRDRLAAGPVALLFGSEKTGLSKSELAHCDWLIRIPTGEDQPSMNLGQAVAVCLYELIRGRRILGPVSRSPAAATQVERVTTLLREVLAESGYTKPRTAASSEQKIRLLVRRMNLTAEDAELWLGIFRQILWKLRR